VRSPRAAAAAAIFRKSLALPGNLMSTMGFCANSAFLLFLFSRQYGYPSFLAAVMSGLRKIPVELCFFTDRQRCT
jgi:hypothetical protein